MTDRKQAIEAMAAAMWIARGGVPRIWAEFLHTPPVPGSEIETTIHHIRRAATAALDALCAMSRKPGVAWRIVPSEATGAMNIAGWASYDNDAGFSGFYRAAVEFAPNPLEDAQRP